MLLFIFLPVPILIILYYFNRPSNDHLFSKNWNENYGFYGNPEAYLTFPISSRERRLLKHDVRRFRGTGSIIPERRSHDGEVDDEEFVDIVRDASDEDLYIANEAPRSLLSLPGYLMGCGLAPTLPPIDALQNFSMNQKRILCATESFDFLIHFFLPIHMSLGSSLESELGHSLNYNGTMHSSFFLDYLPILRNISVLETIAESVAKLLAPNDSMIDDDMTKRRVSTRRSRSLGHRHYFEKVYPEYVWQESEYTAKDIGFKLTKASLVYKARGDKY